MPQKTNAELITAANTIKNETNPLANTAVRLGNFLLDLIDSKINPVNDLDTDNTLAADSDVKVASQKAIKSYVAGVIPAAYNKGYLDYRVRLFQSLTGNPSVQYTFINELNAANFGDPTYRRVSFSRTGVGLYLVTITTTTGFPTASSKVDLSFSDGKCNILSNSSSDNGTNAFCEFAFETRNSSGVLADSIIVWTNCYIRLYP